MLGPGTSAEATLSAIAASVYLVPQISYGASSQALSNSGIYPYFSRTIPPDNLQTQIFVDLILYFYNQTNQIQWLNVSVICTADDYGVGAAKQFIENAEEATPNITIAVFQQFLVDATDVYQEVNILKDSKVRVFFSAMNAEPFVVLMKEAIQQKLVGDQYVWFCTDGCTSSDIFMSGGSVNKELLNAERGLIGALPVSGVGSYPLFIL
jgi:ABC-type branched-subunit amino acid transport system substrate-binding protein